MSDKKLGNVLVVIQFVLLGLILFFPKGNSWQVSSETGMIALALTLGGLMIAVFAIFRLGSSLTANPVPKEDSSLVTTGLYSRIRHPIYTGLLVMCIGLTISSRSFIVIAFCVALWILFMIKARFEDKLLLAHYPEFAEYASKTGRFIPFVGKIS